MASLYRCYRRTAASRRPSHASGRCGSLSLHSDPAAMRGFCHTWRPPLGCAGRKADSACSNSCVQRPFSCYFYRTSVFNSYLHTRYQQQMSELASMIASYFKVGVPPPTVPAQSLPPANSPNRKSQPQKASRGDALR